MGCCFSKKNALEGPLLREKGSIDYNEMDTKLQWDTLDVNKKKLLDVQYVATDDTHDVSNRLTLGMKATHSQNQMDDVKHMDISDWKPSIIKTYKIKVKAIIDLANKELLALIKMYGEYFDDLKENDKERLNTDKNGNYESYLSLYNWFKVENKRGGQQVKAQRITSFSIGNNVWQLPTDITDYLDEYYMKTNCLTQTEKEIESTLDERDTFYIKRIRDIIRINGEWLETVNYMVHNDMILYYKIYEPTNLDLHSNRIPLILISEHGQCKEDWFIFPNLLSKHRRVITFDLRGIGQTGICEDDTSHSVYSIDLLSSDIAALVETLYGNKLKICVLGNGYLGGVLAQSLCIRFGDLFNGLIICNSLIPCYKGPEFENVYINEFNHKFASNSNFKNTINKKKKETDDFVHIGCVESVTIDDHESDETKEGNKVLFSKHYNDINKKKYDFYSYIMETKLNDRESPFLFNTINGNIPSSLLNRPSIGLMAQRNGFIKLISTKINDISSKIHEIRHPILIFYGDKDHVVPCSFSIYLEKKLIDTKFKEVKEVSNAGHLWWLTHPTESADIINQFLFKIEEDLLVRYDVFISSINLFTLNNADQYTLIVRSDSFISDRDDKYQEQYSLSVSTPSVCCEFLCRLEDLGRKPFHIEIKSKSGDLIGYGQCILSEATNAILVIDILDVNNYRDILIKVDIKHGVIKPITTNDGSGMHQDSMRLDSADFSGLDL